MKMFNKSEYYKKYRLAHAKEISDKNNKWQKENPEKRKEIQRKAYHKKIKLSELQNKSECFIVLDNAESTYKILNQLYKNGYSFIYNYYCNLSYSPDEIYNSIMKDFHNTYNYRYIPVLHFYFNSITNKKEIQITTRKTIKSYPQYKNAKIYYGLED